VTKASLNAETKKKNDAVELDRPSVKAAPVEEIPAPRQEQAVIEQGEKEVEAVEETTEEQQARAISDKQLKKYWKGIEEARKTRRGEFAVFTGLVIGLGRFGK
jgi:hypothetical protein